MKVLLRKELRELRTPVLAVLACALLLGLADLAYNWTDQRLVGLSLAFCLAVAVLGSFVGGANAVARETTDHLAFLGSWPVRRRDVWLAKLVANLAAVIVAAVASFVICGGLLALRGHPFAETYLQITGLPLPSLSLFCLTLFAFGFSASWLTTSPLGAAGIAAFMLAVPALIWTMLMLGGVADRWGPWLGFHYGSLAAPQQAFYDVLPFLLLSVAVLIAGARGFLRYPILDLRQRARLTYRLFAALSALSLGLAVIAVLTMMPRLVAHPVHKVKLAANGQYLAFLAGPGGSAGPPTHDSLWALSTMGGPPKLIARGPISQMDVAPDGRHVLFNWGADATMDVGPLWLADLPTGRLWRTPAASWPDERAHPARWSPRGKYLLLYGPEGLMVIEGRSIVATLETAGLGQIIGWAADETALYSAPDRGARFFPGGTEESSQRPVWRVDLRTGKRTVVTHVSDDLELSAVSPNGQWIVGRRTVEELVRLHPEQAEERPFPSPVDELQLLDMANGEARSFRRLSPCTVPFTPNGRYLWCRYEPRMWDNAIAPGLRVIDLWTARIVHSISLPPTVQLAPPFSGMTISVGPQALEVGAFAPQSGLAYLVETVTSSPHAPRPDARNWVANADGGNVRPVPAFSGELLGFAAGGELVIRREPAQFVRRNPETGGERVVWTAQ